MSVSQATRETRSHADSALSAFESLKAVAADLARSVTQFVQQVTTDLDERRGAVRVGVDETGFLHVRGRRHQVRVVEVSSYGARVADAPHVAVGSSVEFEAGDGVRVQAEVAWSEGGKAGLSVPCGLRHPAVLASSDLAA